MSEKIQLPHIREIFPDLLYLFDRELPIKKPKRKRKTPGQVDRIFECHYQDCDKSYGSLHHLNTHKKNKNHGKNIKLKDIKKKD